MQTILTLTNLHPYLEAELPKHFRVLGASNLEERNRLIQERGADITGVIGAYNIPFDLKWLAHMPNLKVISSFGVGYDVYDLACLKAKNIALSNTPSVLNDTVADTAMALLLAASRGLIQADKWVREGVWQSGKVFPLMSDIHHKKVGIVGLGAIGQVIAKRLTGFDADIRYFSRTAKNVPYLFEPNLKKLAQWADVLIVITVGGPETKHLINKEILECLGENGVLINVARGSVVDENVLIDVLEQGKLGAAGLDVFANEPNVPSRLINLPNVVLSPHVGSATQECRLEMAKLTLNNLIQFFESGTLITPVV
ncbi:2-hydroxyacid dehydrogenase [Basilea psittacipulmonis]|nr:2-hydroxyacid dehydrogenase [Basilea psittacipulmonis]